MNNPKNGPWLVYGVTFILAACSILYELVIAQALSLLTGNTVKEYSLVIGVYLGAMGLGVLAFPYIYHEGRAGWQALFRLELFLSLSGAVSVMLLHFGHMVYSFLFLAGLKINAVLIFFFCAFCVVIQVGFLTGMELPILMGIAEGKRGGNKLRNRVLSADYFGSLFGALAFAMVLLPRMSPFKISFLTALLNACCAAWILFSQRERPRIVSTSAAVAAAVIVLASAFIINYKIINQYFLKKYYYYAEGVDNAWDIFQVKSGFPEVRTFNSAYQRIDIVKRGFMRDRLFFALSTVYSRKLSRETEYPKDYNLFLNGDYQFSSMIEEMYHEYFAHIPVIISGEVPKDVLVLGGGDGLLCRELLKHPQISSITVVEIDPKMVSLSREDDLLRRINRDSMNDKRIKVVIADAYHYIREDGRFYDAIYMDFPAPVDYNLSKLYSREFYYFVGKRIKNNGYVAFDISNVTPYLCGKDKDLKGQFAPEAGIYARTLKTAGFKTVLPYMVNLEKDNPAARAVVMSMQPFARRMKDGLSWVGDADLADMEDEILDSYVKGRREGFIVARKSGVPFRLEYSDPSVSLDVLNAERFKLAFEFSCEDYDSEEINSIMRPVLPPARNWQAKLPY